LRALSILVTCISSNFLWRDAYFSRAFCSRPDTAAVDNIMSMSSMNTLQLRGHTYELSVAVTADQLRLQLSDGREENGEGWTASFPAKCKTQKLRPLQTPKSCSPVLTVLASIRPAQILKRSRTRRATFGASLHSSKCCATRWSDKKVAVA
jgi:hypothetical protein